MIQSKTLVEQSTLPLMEQFYSIQGEGYHQGKPAFFIRLAGCNVGCVWCDVKESWDANKHKLIAVEEMAHSAAEIAAPICIITGGEPLMYNLDELTGKLRRLKKQTHLETSGAYPLSGSWDWICVSPKKFKPPLPEVLQAAHELKIVVYNKSDFEWAASFMKKVNANCRFFLQPEWSREKEMLPQIVEYIKRNPQWNISLQVHKYMNIP